MAQPGASVDRRTIPHLHWQHKLGLAASTLGEIVFGLDDLEQAIATICITYKGSVPLQPEKCCDLLPYIDRAPAVAIPNLAREIWDGIAAWEPRVVVEKVVPRPLGDSRWLFPVSWYPRADVTRQIRLTEVTFGAP